MSVNDRLYDELLKPIAEAYYACVKSLPSPGGDQSTEVSRAWHLGRMRALMEDGDRIAAVLNVAEPEWETTRVLAGRDS